MKHRIAVIAGVALGTIPYFIPQDFHYLLYTLIFIAALTTSVISSRGPAYFLVLAITAFHIFQHIQNRLVSIMLQQESDDREADDRDRRHVPWPG